LRKKDISVRKPERTKPCWKTFQLINTLSGLKEAAKGNEGVTWGEVAQHKTEFQAVVSLHAIKTPWL
jgi:hypothetical protein